LMHILANLTKRLSRVPIEVGYFLIALFSFWVKLIFLIANALFLGFGFVISKACLYTSTLFVSVKDRLLGVLRGIQHIGFPQRKLKSLLKVFYRKSLGAVSWFLKNIWAGLAEVFRSLRTIVHFLITLPFKVIRYFIKSRFFVFILGGASTLVFVVVPLEFYRLARELPDPGTLVEKGTRQSTKILDRHGALLYEIYEDRKFDPVPLEEIPDHLVEATLAIEDLYFYEHRGLRVESMARAARVYVVEGKVQGASTITQQLIKNLLLTPERTFTRKAKELILSVMVEKKYTKDQILELYFNNISYGGVAWGAEPAAKEYFGKSVGDLTLAEASLLAGLPSAPSVYSPASGNWELTKRRQAQVLDRMVAAGFITRAEAAEAFEEDLTIVPQDGLIRAPHFVFYVRSLLEERYGPRAVTFGGLSVTTTLDLGLHEEVQHLVTEGVEANARVGLTNGAAVVLDVKTGGILAYVGSVDFFEDSWGAFDVIQSPRQPGSAVKPITYSLAFSRGLTPASVVEDRPVSYPQPAGKPYQPVNYDGKFRGKVTLREALASSYNIPAVKVVDYVGPDNMVALGKDMGMVSWDLDTYHGLAVTLGSKEARLIELTNTFGTLARGGAFIPTEPFLKIEDIGGRVLYERPPLFYEQVVDPGIAFIVSDILSDNRARAPAFGYNSPLHFPDRDVAVKTGTTDDKKDNWTVGYTPSVAVGVWVGNNDNTPMNRYLASGLTGAAPIWNSIMSHILEDYPKEEFTVPEDVVSIFDERCGRREYFLRGSNIPQALCPVESHEDSEKKDD
jgi:penicillin-binding protein 1C